MTPEEIKFKRSQYYKAYYHRTADKQRARAKQYHQENKETRNTKSKEWKSKNQEQVKKYSAEYRKEYYTNNKDKYIASARKNYTYEKAKQRREILRDYFKDYFKTYAKKHNREFNARNAKRRAGLKQRTPIWAELDLIKEIYINCPQGHHVDHIIPLHGETVSGLHVVANLQYLPAQENLSKKNKLMEQYICN